ncbi:MAG: hypothetical protein LBB90_04485, partial [Tannerella sp.]|nr:hypothetical protein [Tannerella sp.]
VHDVYPFSRDIHFAVPEQSMLSVFFAALGRVQFNFGAVAPANSGDVVYTVRGILLGMRNK